MEIYYFEASWGKSSMSNQFVGRTQEAENHNCFSMPLDYSVAGGLIFSHVLWWLWSLMTVLTLFGSQYCIDFKKPFEIPSLIISVEV